MIESIQVQKAAKRITLLFKNLSAVNPSIPCEVQKTIRKVHNLSSKLQRDSALKVKDSPFTLEAYYELKKIEKFLLSETFIESHLLKVPYKKLSEFNLRIQSIRDCIGNLEEQDFLYMVYS